MPLVSATSKTLQIKIVYYGPGLSGKTTNLEQLNHILARDRVGEMMSLDTKGDRTLFFDWIPVDLGKIRGFDVRIQLYTVPGQVRYNKTRQQVLRGVDGVVFVADSQRAASEQNKYSFNNLRENLALMGLDLEEIPTVIQCNKKDLPDTMTTREIALDLSAEHLPCIAAIANQGKGVTETLRLITRVALKSVKQYLSPSSLIKLEKKPQESLDGDSLLERILTDDAVSKEIQEAEEAEMAASQVDSSMFPVGESNVVGISSTMPEPEVAPVAPAATQDSEELEIEAEPFEEEHAPHPNEPVPQPMAPHELETPVPQYSEPNVPAHVESPAQEAVEEVSAADVMAVEEISTEAIPAQPMTEEAASDPMDKASPRSSDEAYVVPGSSYPPQVVTPQPEMAPTVAEAPVEAPMEAPTDAALVAQVERQARRISALEATVRNQSREMAELVAKLERVGTALGELSTLFKA